MIPSKNRITTFESTVVQTMNIAASGKRAVIVCRGPFLVTFLGKQKSDKHPRSVYHPFIFLLSLIRAKTQTADNRSVEVYTLRPGSMPASGYIANPNPGIH
jgi:hypothetical protein